MRLLLFGILLIIFACSKEENSDLISNNTPSCTPLAATTPVLLGNMPYIGTNLTHHGNQLDGYSIIQNYHNVTDCLKIQSDLVTMRSRGAQTIRILLWHFDHTEPQNWGVIPHRLPSGGIGIPEPYRTNFIRYLQDIKNAGYARVIIGFAPMAQNNPFQDWQNCQADYFEIGNPDYFTQNWEFIQAVRSLAIEHGPADIRFDLLNEGVPNIWLDSSCTGGKSTRAQVKKYGTDMLQAFFDTYGPGNATISVITSARVLCTSATTYNTTVLQGSFQDLLDMHAAYTPGWFALHMYDADDSNCNSDQKLGVIYQGLLAADNFFTSQGFPNTPFVIQETYHNDSVVRSKIDQFIQGSSRGIEEILSWPHSVGSSSHIDVAPPYLFDEYGSLQ